jgi:hypothetical protein
MIRLESAMAHDQILNPLYKERKLQTRECACIYFDDQKIPVIQLDMFSKTQNHISFLILFGFFRQDKIWSRVAFVLDPRRKVDKKS